MQLIAAFSFLGRYALRPTASQRSVAKGIRMSTPLPHPRLYVTQGITVNPSQRDGLVKERHRLHPVDIHVDILPQGFRGGRTAARGGDRQGRQSCLVEHAAQMPTALQGAAVVLKAAFKQREEVLQGVIGR